MASPLERAIMRLRIHSGGRGLECLISHLDTTSDILALRAACLVFAKSKVAKTRAFSKVYSHWPTHGEQCGRALATIGPYCQDLELRLAYPDPSEPEPWYRDIRQPHHEPRDVACDETVCDCQTRNGCAEQIGDDHDRELPHRQASRSCSVNHELLLRCALPDPLEPELPLPRALKFALQRRPNQIDPVKLEEWRTHLSCFSNIKTLTIACNGDPAWNGCTDIEMALIYIRISLESLNPVFLDTVSINPIHAIGILHLRWAGIGAYGAAAGTATPSHDLADSEMNVWQKLQNLELRILNPYKAGRLGKQQRDQFEKVLADYIRSFKPTLKKFKFGWIDCKAGPDILWMTKHYDSSHMGNARSWTRLEEVWLENTIASRRSIVAAEELAPFLQRAMVTVRRMTVRGRREVGTQWADLLHRPRDKSPAGTELSVISTTSRLIPIGLDVY